MLEIESWTAMYQGRKDERPLEYRFVWNNLHLPLEGWKKILDVGCCESKVCEILVNLGYEVTGIDIRNYKKCMGKNPIFTFIKDDVRLAKLDGVVFDQILSISTIEHIGIKAYGNSVFDDHGDKKAMEKIYGLLSSHGNCIITVPVGNHQNDYWIRYYDKKALLDLISKFKIEDQAYYKKITHVAPHSWFRCTIDEAVIMGVDEGGLPKAIACFRLSKK